jgi:hypothetical protein
MKVLTIFSTAVITLGIGLSYTGCEMHPPSETIPGYSEKSAAKQARDEHQALTPEGAQQQAPTYFPKESSQN